jgi:hypothetical protein
MVKDNPDNVIHDCVICDISMINNRSFFGGKSEVSQIGPYLLIDTVFNK